MGNGNEKGVIVMEKILMGLLMGFSIVLLVHSWLLINLSRKYDELEKRKANRKKRQPRPNSDVRETVRVQKKRVRKPEGSVRR